MRRNMASGKCWHCESVEHDTADCPLRQTTDDRAAKKAASLWLKTKTEFTGNWHIDLDDQALIVNAVAAELREYGAQVRDEAAKIAKQHDDEHHACTHQLRICGFIIAGAVRKMELP